MRVALGQFSQLSDERLTYAAQLGVSGVVLNTPVMPGKRWEHFDIVRGKERWHYLDLVELRTTCENYGLRLEAIENVPVPWLDKVMLGLPGRDEQIENYQETIRNLGRAGIHVLGYHFMPNLVWRTSFTTFGRGRAQVSSFDLAQVADAPMTHDRVYTEADLVANLRYFLQAVLPVAEESGVVLALHPDDPPVETLGGVARILRSFDHFKQAMELVPSPNHQLDLCLGCWSEMGAPIPDVIDYFGSRKQIAYVHFRDVKGTIPCFAECFIDEGNMDVVDVFRALKRNTFDGFIIDDHVPHMTGDTEYGHRGHAHATGYLQAMVEAVTKLG